MIKDLKELQALLKLCRKQGITEINLGGILIKFGELPTRKPAESDDASDEIHSEDLSDEQMMFLSAGGPFP